MSRIVYAHGTYGSFANHTIHGQTFIFVFTADDVSASDLVSECHLAGRRLQQIMFGQWSSRRMTVLPARVAVQDLTLFAKHSGVGGRFTFAQLTLGHNVPELTITVDDVAHGGVLGQVVGAVVVEVDDLLAGRT